MDDPDNSQDNSQDIEYLKHYIQGSDVCIKPDERHNLHFNAIQPHLFRGVLYEPEYYPYRILHKNTDVPLKIEKIYPPVHYDDKKEYCSEFKKVSKTRLFRHRKIIDSLEEELSYVRYKQTESSDSIEQLPMIKLFMIAFMAFDHVEYRVTADEEDEFDPRVEFRFWFYDEIERSYSKEVMVSVDHGILCDRHRVPLIITTDHPTSDLINEDTPIKLDVLERFEIQSNHFDRVHILHLLVKALLFISNILKINLQRANINSYIATIRGGRIYRLEPKDKTIDVLNLQLSLDDVKDRDPETIHSMWIADNILDVLTGIQNPFKQKLARRTPTLAGLAEQNRVLRIDQYNQKRIAIPFSPYGIMIKNLYESDTLLGITAANTFLYIVDSLEVNDKAALNINFLNPIRGNAIPVDLFTILSCFKRIGLILDRTILHQISGVTI